MVQCLHSYQVGMHAWVSMKAYKWSKPRMLFWRPVPGWQVAGRKASSARSSRSLPFQSGTKLQWYDSTNSPCTTPCATCTHATRHIESMLETNNSNCLIICTLENGLSSIVKYVVYKQFVKWITGPMHTYTKSNETFYTLHETEAKMMRWKS